jgi:transglutaminase-like putative cysteine protease
MDFAAWFEAYLGGGWYTFDARNNLPRIGRGLSARGRDAAAVAIATTFGPNTLENLRVWTDEVEGFDEGFDAASVSRTNHPRTCHAPPANFAPPSAAFAPGPVNFRN